MNRHAGFCVAYLHFGLLAALTSGFALAAYLATHLGLGLSITPALPAVIQVHGAVQVFGWLGLLIMGVSLHVLPRLSGAPLGHARWVAVPAYLVTTSLVLRTAAQLALGLGEPIWAGPALVVAGIAMGLGGVVYVWMIAASLRSASIDPHTHPKIASLRPLLVIALAGWLTCTAAMGVGVVSTALTGGGLVAAALHVLCLDLFVAAVVLPVAFVFSRQLLPLYLGIEVSRTPLTAFAAVYAAATVLDFGSRAAGPLLEPTPHAVIALGQLAAVVRGLSLIWFVVGLRLHRRRQRRGTVNHQDGWRRYGHFAPLIHLAYTMLVLAAVGQILSAAGSLAGISLGLREAGLRHAYVAGFGTLLMLGVAPRMLPGLLGARGPAYPRLVLLSLLLAAPAAVGVSLGLLLPADGAPAWVRLGFAASGSLAWVAVALLAANLWTTWRRQM